MVMVGTFSGSELSPNPGAVAPMADVLDEEKVDVFAEENGVSVAPALDCVPPKFVDPNEPVVPKVGLVWVGLVWVGPADGMTWACAASATARHIMIAKMNVRSMAES